MAAPTSDADRFLSEEFLEEDDDGQTTVSAFLDVKLTAEAGLPLCCMWATAKAWSLLF
jgi:hypothetical protein